MALAKALCIEEDEPCRMSSIKLLNAIKNAIKNQGLLIIISRHTAGRRVLDRLVGYKSVPSLEKC